MILHLILDEKFTTRIIEFMNQNYQNHVFILYYKKALKYCDKIQKENVHLLNLEDSNFTLYMKLFEMADQIIIHSIFFPEISRFFHHKKKLLKKAVFVIWGGDIYNDHIEKIKFKNPFKLIRHKYRLHLKYQLIHNIHTFMTFTYGDFDLVKKWYRTYGKGFDVLYPSTINKEDLDKNATFKDSKITNIIIGNSATPTNNHLEAFLAIEHFKNQCINIYCPLSYGDLEYGKKIAKIGKEKFGDKFIPIFDYMSPNQYAQLLSKMHIAIFAHNRQQATGNIEILSYYGAKLYLKNDIATWSHYVERDHRKFFNFYDISKMSFDDFIEINESDKEDNKKYFENIWDNNHVKKLWDAVLVK